MAVETVDLMPSQTPPKKPLMPFQTVSNTPFTASQAAVTFSLTHSIAVETPILMPSQAPMTISLQFSQIKRKGRVRIWNAAENSSLMNMIPTCTTFLIVSHTEETVPAMAFHTDSKMPFTVFQAVEMPELIAVVTVVTVFFSPFQIPSKKDLIPLHTVSKKPFTAFQAVDTAVEMAVAALETALFSPFQMPTKKVLMAFHTVSNTDLMFSHRAPQSPSNLSSSTPKSESTARTGISRPLITPVNRSEIPERNADQSPSLKPLIRPTTIWMTPLTMSMTLSMLSPMDWITAVTSGSRALHSQSQAAEIASPRSLKEKPRELMRLVILSAASANFAFTDSQIPMTLFLNSSLFFQRCTNAAVRAATTAMIAQPTGPMPAMAPASFPPAPTPSFA